MEKNAYYALEHVSGPAIGFVHARNLMKQLDWKLLITMDGKDIIKIVVYHPLAKGQYTVRRDAGKKLLPLCRVVRPLNQQTALMCFDHEGSNEDIW